MQLLFTFIYYFIAIDNVPNVLNGKWYLKYIHRMNADEKH